MNGLEKAHSRLREIKDRGETIRKEENLIKKSLANLNSKAKAIGAFCFHCMGGTKDYMPDPGWKQMIRSCTAPDCPLYPHRPYR